MAAPIVISVVVDPAGAVKGAGQVDAALEKTGKAVDAVSENGAVNTAKLTEQFRAQTQVVQSGTSDQTRVIKQAGEEQTEAVELSSGEQNRIQKESLKASHEALIGAVENTATSLQGISTDVLGTLGNIGANLAAFATGPVALIATAGTVAFGLIQGQIQKAQAEAKIFAADVEADTAALEKSGKAGVAGITAVNSALTLQSQKADANGVSLATNAANAKILGTNYADLSRALAGNIPLAEKQLEAGKANAAQLQAQSDQIIQQQKNGITTGAQNLGQLTEQRTAQDAVNSSLETVISAYKQSTENVELNTKAQERGEAQVKATAAAQKDYADSVKSSEAGIEGSIKKGNTSFHSLLEARAKDLKDEAEKTANIEEIYKKFGLTAGAALVSELEQSSKPGAALASAAKADAKGIATYKAQMAAYGKLGADQVTAGATTALAKTTIPGPKVDFGDPETHAAEYARKISAYYRAHPVTISALLKDKKNGATYLP